MGLCTLPFRKNLPLGREQNIHKAKFPSNFYGILEKAQYLCWIPGGEFVDISTPDPQPEQTTESAFENK